MCHFRQLNLEAFKPWEVVCSVDFSELGQFRFILRAWVFEPLPDLIPVGIQPFDLKLFFFETWIKLRICSCFCTKQCAGAQFNLELWILSHFRLAALCWVSQSCHLARIVLLLLHASSANALGALILVARVGTRSLWSRKDPMPSVPIASTWTSPARSTLKWRLMCCKSS